jgi:hypothetical protein
MSTSYYKLARISAYLIGIILVILPFHAFVTVWLSAGLGHYTALRLWKEMILLVLCVGGLALVKPYKRLFAADIIWKLIALFLILNFVSGLIAYLLHDVSGKAFAYGLLIDNRFLIFFALVTLFSHHTGWLRAHWQQLMLIPAIFVVLFGLLQFSVLPPDFLKHFGYGPNTIPVSSTVDQKVDYLRIGSTLRGANPLGAYLVIITTAFAALYLKTKKYYYIAALVATLSVLAFTYSRSAWIGTAVSIALLIWLSLTSRKTKRIYVGSIGILIVMGLLSVLVLRNNSSFENTVFHTDRSSHSSISSNAGHAAALSRGIKDIAHHPLGSGTGTAGPASTYNNIYPARIAENYYIQIGQETGWVGFILFIAITIRVSQLLWQKRTVTLNLLLLTSFVGLVLVNMLSHAWADDTLAYVWWGFAGIGLSVSPIATKQGAKLNKKRSKSTSFNKKVI